MIHPQVDFYLFVAVLAIALHLWFRFVTRVCDAVVRWRLEKDFEEMERLHRIRQQVGQREW